MVLLPNLTVVIGRLQKLHGKPPPHGLRGPLEMILWENVVYLADDRKRKVAFDVLRRQIGLTFSRILAASDAALRSVTSLAGILPDTQVAKLRKIARTVGKDFDGNLNSILKLPLPQAKKALKKFPAIGDPGAEKILLFCRVQPVLALESNGLRVLLRLGFGEEQKNYAASYRSAQEAVKTQLKDDFDWLIKAHQLLRRHGQEICKRANPLCGECPLTKDCRYFAENEAQEK